jgi:hypothetical protein
MNSRGGVFCVFHVRPDTRKRFVCCCGDVAWLSREARRSVSPGGSVRLLVRLYQGGWQAVVLPVLTGTDGAQAGTSRRKMGEKGLYRPIRNRHWQSPVRDHKKNFPEQP